MPHTRGMSETAKTSEPQAQYDHEARLDLAAVTEECAACGRSIVPAGAGKWVHASHESPAETAWLSDRQGWRSRYGSRD